MRVFNGSSRTPGEVRALNVTFEEESFYLRSSNGKGLASNSGVFQGKGNVGKGS